MADLNLSPVLTGNEPLVADLVLRDPRLEPTHVRRVLQLLAGVAEPQGANDG